MLSAVGTIGPVASGPIASVPATPPATVSVSLATPGVHAAAGPPVRNPRVVVDPVAGLITEFTAGGSVVNQFPSTTVVAYLRLGLDADGFSKSQTPGRATTFA
jgi:hypothetical protein